MLLFCVIVSLSWTTLTAAPFQKLEPIPGYVPVYIREGDTALNEINPDLAEAFQEDKFPKIPTEELKNLGHGENKDEEKIEIFQAKDALINRKEELEATENKELVITQEIEGRKPNKTESVSTDISSVAVVETIEAKPNESFIKESSKE
uniref:DUF4794 domain-containing protein n=1 Tax=Glossina brevipalpis TaxID=37001 RepID=A0A1A9WFK4_9MUSC